MPRYVAFLRGVSLVLSLMISATVSGQAAGPAHPPGEGKPIAPAFSLTSLEGAKFDLSALRGKVVVLNFWFAGCAPCVAEFGKLNGLVNKFKDKGVVFIAPALDDETILRPFLKKHRFKYHVVPNAGSLIFNTYRDGSGKVAFPTHIVIDREGKIDTRLIGAEVLGDLQKAIARLTGAGPTASAGDARRAASVEPGGRGVAPEFATPPTADRGSGPPLGDVQPVAGESQVSLDPARPLMVVRGPILYGNTAPRGNVRPGSAPVLPGSWNALPAGWNVLPAGTETRAGVWNVLPVVGESGPGIWTARPVSEAVQPRFRRP